MSDLDRILSGESQVEQDIKSQETIDTSAEETIEVETVEAEQNEKSDKAEETEEIKSQKQPDELNEDLSDRKALVAQAKDERRKRQELKREIEQLRSQQQAKQELPDVFDDQKGFADGMRNEVDQKIANVKLQLAVEMMMDAHDDYEEMETFFIEEIAPEYPMLAEEARKAANPAKFVYKQAKKFKEYKELQDVDSIKAKIRAELKAEMEAEKKVAQQKEAQVNNITPSLAKARASDKGSFQKATLGSILGR